jgi:hypothetical protein
MERQLPLGSERTLTETLRHTLEELQIVKLAVGSSIRLWKTSDRACGGAGPLLSGRRGYAQLPCRDCRSTGHFLKMSPHRLEVEMVTHL